MSSRDVSPPLAARSRLHYGWTLGLLKAPISLRSSTMSNAGVHSPRRQYRPSCKQRTSGARWCWCMYSRNRTRAAIEAGADGLAHLFIGEQASPRLRPVCGIASHLCNSDPDGSCWSVWQATRSRLAGRPSLDSFHPCPPAASSRQVGGPDSPSLLQGVGGGDAAITASSGASSGRDRYGPHYSRFGCGSLRSDAARRTEVAGGGGHDAAASTRRSHIRSCPHVSLL
jgi:hypothetical protein